MSKNNDTKKQKRKPGDGSWRTREDGRIEHRARIGVKQESFYGWTETECRRQRREAERRFEQGLPVQGGKVKVAAYLRSWIEQVVRPSVRPSTFRSYGMHVERHLIPAIGSVRLDALTPGHVRTMMNNLLEDGLAPRTVALVRATLRNALNVAVADGLVTRNVAALAKPPKIEQFQIPAMTVERADAIVAAVESHRLGALYILALGCGLRLGEVLALTWSDLDLEAGTLSVCHALQRIDGDLTLVEPKSAAARRTIRIPAFVVRALRQHRRTQVAERLESTDWCNDSDFVFTTRSGGPLDGPSVTRVFHRLLHDKGLDRMRIHDLRHGCATLLLQRGVSPRTVQHLLGHSSITLTLGTYSHVTEGLLREAADTMDGLFTKAS